MAEELAMVKTPEIPATGKLGFAESIKIQEPFLKKKAELQKGITSAEGDIAKAEQAKSEVLQQGKMQAVQDFGTAQKGAMQRYEQRLEEEPLPAFVPTKDTARDIAGLFSIVSVIGMIAGKQSGLRAMSAMNGMLEGYQKGRGDLYKKEAAEFDKNFKSMLKKHEEFRKEMEDAIKLAATDKEAGYQAAELAATKAGSTVVQAQLRKGDLVGAYNLVKESAQGAEKAFTLESNLRQKADEAAERDRRNKENIAAANERARLQREQQLELERIKAGKRAAGKVLTDKQSREIEGLDSISKGLESLKKDFKPEFASLGVFGFGADLEFEAKRRLGDEEAQKAISWWSRYERLQAPNRHALFGATLTGNELKNYQSFTAKKSDSPETVKTMLQDQIDYSKSVGDNKKLTFEAAGYQVPEARARNFDESFSGGGDAQYEQEAKSKFGAYEPDKYEYGYENGKFYRDEK